MSQLPQGAVKITFGELRQASPAGTFLEVASQDQTLVELPLPEILSRLNPSHLQRRTPQKTLDAPAEVGNLFGPRGETLPPADVNKSAPPGKVAAVTASPKPVAPLSPASPGAAKPSLPNTSTPTPKPPVPSPPRPVAFPPNPPASSAPISMPKPQAQAVPAAPIPAPKIPLPSAPASAAKPPAPALTPPGPTPNAETQYLLKKESAASADTLTVPLAALCENWPESIKEEIAKLNMEECAVAIPMSQLEVAMRAGKILFPWKQVASWLKPDAPAVTTQGEITIELPLRVIAPLFIAQHRPAKPQRKLSVGENIPDIFSGSTLPGKVPAVAASAPVSSTLASASQVVPAVPENPAVQVSAPSIPISAPSLPKAAPVPAAPKPAPIPPLPIAAPVAKAPTTMGEVFNQPEKKEWPPQEIVQKTAALKGMSGALITTNDGLLVAGHLPAPFKADTVGAFLPQIFSRMTQYGKELQAGEMNSLQVEFNKVPWYVVKLGHIYFGAIGKVGETFPISQLKVISSELGKPTK